MTLRKEIAQLIAGGQQMHGDEIERLANKYGVDTHEIAFIWDCAEQGYLDEVRGPVIDKEVADAE
jgi:hypothetical protein